jgi:hypothetical protein
MKHIFICQATYTHKISECGVHKIHISLLKLHITPKKIGVWAAISQRKIIGPYFFQGKLL